MVATRRRHDLVSLADLDSDQLRFLVSRAVEYARDRTLWDREPLAGCVVGTYFRYTSTRTRTAFSVGALRLGAQVTAFGPGDLQLNTGESMSDTGRVLSGMLDALVARTAGPPEELRTLACHDAMAVINAMSADEHPTQAITDLATVLQRCGRIENLRMLYLGEGNNTAAALALALPRFPGTELHLRTPPGYGVEADKLRLGAEYARGSGALIDERHDLGSLPDRADVVYTTRWRTTGTVKPDPDWQRVFAPFRVDAALMRRYPDAIFMHDLPAHRGEEVDAAVIDGERSVVFQQAQNKLHGAMAVLEWCLLG